MAVFDWFDVLAYPDSHASHPNRLKEEYGGATGDSHPNATANAYSTEVFATNPDNFIDNAWENFVNATPPSPRAGIYASPQAAEQNDLITFSVVITGPLTTAAMTSTVPAGLAYQPSSMAATSGVADDSGAPTLHWTGSVTASGTVTVTYETLVVTADRAAIADQVQISAPGQNTQIWETTLMSTAPTSFARSSSRALLSRHTPIISTNNALQHKAREATCRSVVSDEVYLGNLMPSATRFTVLHRVIEAQFDDLAIDRDIAVGSCLPIPNRQIETPCLPALQ